MLAMPVAGWVILSASGKTIPFFGLELPALVGQSKTLAAQVKAIHETVGTIGYLLIGLHALAALYHHYVVTDDTLRRMRSEENTSELKSLMRISYAVFCLKKQNKNRTQIQTTQT